MCDDQIQMSQTSNGLEHIDVIGNGCDGVVNVKTTKAGAGAAAAAATTAASVAVDHVSAPQGPSSCSGYSPRDRLESLRAGLLELALLREQHASEMEETRCELLRLRGNSLRRQSSGRSSGSDRSTSPADADAPQNNADDEVTRIFINNPPSSLFIISYIYRLQPARKNSD